jgi:hypothetical protein
VIGTLTGVTKDLGLRFNVVSLLPAGALALFVFGLLASGAPDHAPDIHRLSKRVASIDAWQASAAFLALIAFTLVIQPLQLLLVRVLEGYWGGSHLGRLLAAPGLWLAKRRRRALERATKLPAGSERSPQQAEATVAAARRLERSFPPETELMPTQLGNVLRSAENRAGGRYGLLTVVTWPRLYPLLPEKTAAIVDDQRDQLDLSARFCAVCLLGAAVSLGLLATHGRGRARVDLLPGRDRGGAPVRSRPRDGVRPPSRGAPARAPSPAAHRPFVRTHDERGALDVPPARPLVRPAGVRIRRWHVTALG